MPKLPKSTHRPPAQTGNDLRGINRLTINAITGLTDLVEAMHANIARRPFPFGALESEPAKGISGLVYRSVRGVTRLTGNGVDLALSRLSPLLDRVGTPAPRDAVVAALNGVLGDHLEATGNPLAINMRLRSRGQPLTLKRKALAAEFPDASATILVLAHGLCMNDIQWRYGGHDHGAALGRDFDCTPVYLHYNSGRHVSHNGHDFTVLLQRLIGEWPVPVERVFIIGHSMGGLLARSACHAAKQAGHDWLQHLDALVFLGTPHHGAPLERAGSSIDRLFGVSPYLAPFARLGKIRSAGIQDLRHGNVHDGDWLDRDGDGHQDGRTPRPLPKGVRCYAVAATTRKDNAAIDDSQMSGDGLVPIGSALGEHPDRRFDLRIPKSHRWIGYDTNHLDMLGSDAVYRQLKKWLSQRPRRDPM
ncbi:MAG: GPI inositol-deacylase [Lysobacter sp.]|nr:GPI inositol-deacylase [Lysobacter sp.]